jgi:hypothetical protein
MAVSRVKLGIRDISLGGHDLVRARLAWLYHWDWHRGILRRSEFCIRVKFKAIESKGCANSFVREYRKGRG